MLNVDSPPEKENEIHNKNKQDAVDWLRSNKVVQLTVGKSGKTMAIGISPSKPV